ncbi:hypothetical protein bsdtb5_11280 [Anaeromicropila herbilytica]|uniref:Uncharacterized protein n=2 Tax=Anaeromicropila herbilytica TaxID=2785025 RepID=A0A7R7EJC4_9FIRM|nr:hypothetical protein bsdtb5_11280 [Anaeromicropila herbilytica]
MVERRYKPTKKRKEPKKKGSYKFSDKTHPKLGIISVILGAISLILMCYLSYLSSSSHGKGNIYIGLFGIVAFIISIFGLVCSVKSVKEKEIFYTFPIIGMVVNGLLVIGCAILYFIGLV